MKFTDDDLKQLKELVADKSMWPVELKSPKVFIALLARLESAEKFLDGYSDLKDDPTYEAWRKTAGK
jgi:hypothetical protein